jgi:hypothetical protein
MDINSRLQIPIHRSGGLEFELAAGNTHDEMNACAISAYDE